jgi:hypothetical protein
VVVLLMLANSRRRRDSVWKESARPAYEQAVLARDLLTGEDPSTEDEVRRQSVKRQVEDAAEALTRAAQSAPDNVARDAASSSAEALRGLGYAYEADRLLRTGIRPPTADELVQADQSRRHTSDLLAATLTRLEKRIGIPDPAEQDPVQP